MKKWWITLILCVATIIPMTSCATFSGQNWQQNIEQLQDDVFLFSKLATRIALFEADMSADDVDVVKSYLMALQDLLAVPGYPNFTGARELVYLELPAKYHVYGFTVIDILERYIHTANLDATNDQAAILSIISACISGAIEAVQEFAQ